MGGVWRTVIGEWLLQRTLQDVDIQHRSLSVGVRHPELLKGYL